MATQLLVVTNGSEAQKNRLKTAIIGLVAACLIIGSAHAERLRVAALRTITVAPLWVAQDKGYFSAEGLSVDFTYFPGSVPINTAVVSGDIDVGVTGFTAAFYALAAQGELRIIAGAYSEAPGFHALTYVASKQAAAAGLTTLKALAGHSIALTQIGSPQHYSLALLADKDGFALGSMKILALQSVENDVSAIAGGKADASILNSTVAVPMIQRGDGVLLGWVGDETPWQFGASFVSRKTADRRADTLHRFLNAFRHGTRDFHDAFTGAGEQRADGPTAGAIEAIIAKYTELPPVAISSAIPYVDPDARLDVKDVLHQIEWYGSQGLLKQAVDGNAIIDRRYVIPLPERPKV